MMHNNCIECPHCYEQAQKGKKALKLLQWFRDTNPTYLAMGLKVKELLEKK